MNTARLARRRSAANIDRAERAHINTSTRAAYSARRANRAERSMVRAELRAGLDDAPALEFDPDALDAITGPVADWML
jgi:hypothetical protein